ncbi:MAG: EFR1 family ferrodoxin, partial [Coprobacillaceae bacterium]
MKNIAIIYHSGTGVTKRVSEEIKKQLMTTFKVSIFSVEEIDDTFDINIFDSLVIGFPVIHTHPSKRILSFINNLSALDKKMPAYIFTTCGWYSANTIRIFSKYCIDKNIIPIQSRVFWGCLASDGSLLAPRIKSFFTFRKKTKELIFKDIQRLKGLLNTNEVKLQIPRFKVYSILNYPNKYVGNKYIHPIYLHQEKCIKCNICVRNCPSKALLLNEKKYPVFYKEKCETCYRCIHYCPNKALSLSKT